LACAHSAAWKESDVGEEEKEADKFAGKLLIPPAQYSAFLREGKFFLEHIKIRVRIPGTSLKRILPM
jgi:hypothetical protein